MTLTYQGIVTAGSDNFGAFGELGSLAGSAFTATLTFDTDFIGRSTTIYQDRLDGGSEFSLPTFLSTQLTIGGITQSFDGPYRQTLVRSDSLIGGFVSDVNVIAAPPSTPVGSNQFALFLNGDLGAKPSLERNGTWTATDSTGHFQLSQYDSTKAAYVAASGKLYAQTATLSGGVVPEPATWAVMILGFGAVGTAIRRRRELA